MWDNDLSPVLVKLFLFSFVYILIQCIAENTFTGATGLPIMLIIGLTLSDNQLQYEDSEYYEQDR